jgi:UDPglucose 6-dehydrogenase
MKQLTKIAIVGYGTVGKAVEFGFRNNQNDIMIIDPYEGYASIDDLEHYQADFTFVCLNVLNDESGNQDVSNIQEVINLLQSMPTGIVVIKSTLTPQYADKFCRYKRFVYNPEFLTERNAFDDFLNPQFHIIGGHPEYTKKVKNLYRFNSNCNPAPVHYMTPTEASLVKYGINTFLAMKVTWFNQWKDLTDGLDARYNVVSNAIASDQRIGHSHTKVPGPDGQPGFGGTCFPKDANAIWNFSHDDFGKGPLTVLEEVLIANNRYRSK